LWLVFAVVYSLIKAACFVCLLWGVFLWIDVKLDLMGTNALLVSMFILFLIGLVFITMSNS